MCSSAPQLLTTFGRLRLLNRYGIVWGDEETTGYCRAIYASTTVPYYTYVDYRLLSYIIIRMRLWEQKSFIRHTNNQEKCPKRRLKVSHNNSHSDWYFRFSYIYIDFTVLFKHFSSWLRARAPALSRSSSTSTQRQKASDSALESVSQ